MAWVRVGHKLQFRTGTKKFNCMCSFSLYQDIRIIVLDQINSPILLEFPCTDAAEQEWLVLYPMGEFCSPDICPLALGKAPTVAMGLIRPAPAINSLHCFEWWRVSRFGLGKGIRYNVHSCCWFRPLQGLIHLPPPHPSPSPLHPSSHPFIAWRRAYLLWQLSRSALVPAGWCRPSPQCY